MAVVLPTESPTFGVVWDEVGPISTLDIGGGVSLEGDGVVSLPPNALMASLTEDGSGETAETSLLYAQGDGEAWWETLPYTYGRRAIWTVAGGRDELIGSLGFRSVSRIATAGIYVCHSTPESGKIPLPSAAQLSVWRHVAPSLTVTWSVRLFTNLMSVGNSWESPRLDEEPTGLRAEIDTSRWEVAFNGEVQASGELDGTVWRVAPERVSSECTHGDIGGGSPNYTVEGGLTDARWWLYPTTSRGMWSLQQRGTSGGTSGSWPRKHGTTGAWPLSPQNNRF